MKTFLSLVLVSLLGATAFADIQDPPGNDYGPTRKLGRGLANLAFGYVEVFKQASEINYFEGNSAAWTYGTMRSAGRIAIRVGTGLWEAFTFPFATQPRNLQSRPYRSNVPWIHGGLEEFPPELGFETHYRYVHEYYTAW